MALPALTVRCHCGGEERVPFGTAWACACGRTWTVDALPPDHAAALVRIRRRFVVRSAAWLAAVALLTAVIALALDPVALVVAPVAAAVLWAALVLPFLRGRRRAEVASLPDWSLRPG